MVKRNKIINAKEIEALWQIVCDVFRDDNISLYDINFNTVLESLHKLSERQQLVLKARYMDKMTYLQIAELIGVSTATSPRDIHSKSLRKLRHPIIANNLLISRQMSRIDELMIRCNGLMKEIEEYKNNSLSSKHVLSETSIEELQLSTRVYNALTRMNNKINGTLTMTIHDIIQIESFDNLCDIRNIGTAGIKELLHKMESLGFDKWVNRITNGIDIDNLKKVK